MKNWFSNLWSTDVKSCPSKVSVVLVLVAILLISQLVTCVNKVVDPVQAAMDEKAFVKGTQESNIQVEDVDEGGIQFTIPDGRTIMLPKRTRGEETLIGNVQDDIIRIYIDDSSEYDNSDYIREDLRIRLDDDHIEIWNIKKKRLVGTLTYNTSLGRLIIDDNEKR